MTSFGDHKQKQPNTNHEFIRCLVSSALSCFVKWVVTTDSTKCLSNQSIHFLAAVWHSHSDHLSTIEKDTNGEVLWVWCYPSTTASLRNLLLRKCCLTDENELLHPFVFGQYRRTWFYITTVEVPDSSVLKKVWLPQGLKKKNNNPIYLKWFKKISCRLCLSQYTLESIEYYFHRNCSLLHSIIVWILISTVVSWTLNSLRTCSLSLSEL